MILARSKQDCCSRGVEDLHEPFEVRSVASSIHFIKISKDLVRNEVRRLLRNPEDGDPDLERPLNVEIVEDVFLGEVSCISRISLLLGELP